MAFGISTLAFALLGWWEWVYLVFLLGVALAVAEVISVRDSGLTITDRFRNKLKEKPREALVGLLIFTTGFAIIVFHLLGVLP